MGQGNKERKSIDQDRLAMTLSWVDGAHLNSVGVSPRFHILQ